MHDGEIGGENGQDDRENFLPGEQLASRLKEASSRWSDGKFWRSSELNVSTLGTTFPQPKTSDKRVAVVAGTAFGRQLPQSLDVAASNYHFVGLESGCEQRDHIRNKAGPPLSPFLLQRVVSHMALIGPLSDREGDPIPSVLRCHPQSWRCRGQFPVPRTAFCRSYSCPKPAWRRRSRVSRGNQRRS